MLEPRTSLKSRLSEFKWEDLLKGHRPFYAAGAVVALILILMALPGDLKNLLGFGSGGDGEFGGENEGFSWMVRNAEADRKVGSRLWKERTGLLGDRVDGKTADGKDSSRPGGDDYEEGEGDSERAEEEELRKAQEAAAFGEEDGISSGEGGAEGGGLASTGAGMEGGASGSAGRLSGSISGLGNSSTISGRPGDGGSVTTRGLKAKDGALRASNTAARSTLLARAGKGGRTATSTARAFGTEGSKAARGFAAGATREFTSTDPGRGGQTGPAGGTAPIDGSGGTAGGHKGGIGGGITPPPVGPSSAVNGPIQDTGMCTGLWEKCGQIYQDFDARISAKTNELNTCRKMVPAGKKGGMVEVIDQVCWDRVQGEIAALRDGRGEAVAECEADGLTCQ